MLTFITIIHLLVSLLLIVLVLIQDSKGGAMGGMLGGGGGSNSLLGATGATNFLVKLTRAVAIVFAATCIFLTIQSTQSKSVIDGFVPPAATGGAAATTDESAESATGSEEIQSNEVEEGESNETPDE